MKIRHALQILALAGSIAVPALALASPPPDATPGPNAATPAHAPRHRGARANANARTNRTGTSHATTATPRHARVAAHEVQHRHGRLTPGVHTQPAAAPGANQKAAEPLAPDRARARVTDHTGKSLP